LGCRFSVERREDSGGQVGRAAAIDKLEQLVNIHLTVVRQLVGDLDWKPERH
jgi:hypothetical protein